MPADVLRNWVLSVLHGFVLLAVKAAVGLYTVTSVCVIVSVQPTLSVTISVVVNVPAVVNTCDTVGELTEAEPPSPNAQEKLVK